MAMIFHWWIVFLQIIIFYDMAEGSKHLNSSMLQSLAAYGSTDTEESNEKPSQDVKTSFGKLLQKIVDVNEKRVNSIQELLQLQDFIITKNKLNSEDAFADDDSDEEIRNSNALLALVDDKNRLPLRIRRSKQDEHSDLSKAVKLIILQKNIPIKNAHPLYRRRSWHDKCNKQAAKVCKKACFRAYKNSCMTYKCSKRAKRTFRRHCKRTCVQNFEADRDSSFE